MKKCPSCGTEWQDNVTFCGNCGTRTEEVPVFNEPQPTYEETQILSKDTAMLYEEAAPLYEEPKSFYYDESKEAKHKPKKNKKPLIITIIAVLAVLIIGAVVGFLTDWFGLLPPMKRIMNAFERTMTAESMTVNVTIRETNRHGDTYKDSGEFKYVIDPDAEQLTFWASLDGEEALLVDDILYEKYESYDSSTIAHIYDNFLDKDAFFEAYDEFINGDDIDMEQIEDLIDELDLSNYIYADELEGLLKEVMKDYLFNKKWLESAAGFEKSGNVYTFEPNVKKILKDAIEICEDTNAFSDEAKDELIELLYEGIDEWEYMDVEEFKISITISKRMIEEIEIIFEDEDYSFELTISISDINKTDITDDEVDEFASETNRIIAENLCSYCGEPDYYKNHGNCVECGKHDSYLYSDGLCSECHYSSSSYGYCDFCDDYAYLYSYGRYDLCWDCYYDY